MEKTGFQATTLTIHQRKQNLVRSGHTGILKELFAETLQEMLEADLDDSLR